MTDKNIRHLFNKFRSHGAPAWKALATAKHCNAQGERAYEESPWRKTKTNSFFIRNGEKCRWMESNETECMRFVGYSDEIVKSIDHNGWYCGDYQDEVMRGVVYQLPARNGSEQYLHGYADPCNEGAAFLCVTLTDNKEEAARWADSMAENAAEEAREYDAKERAELDISESKEEIARLRKATIALIAEAKGHKFAPAICDAIKSQVRKMLADRSEEFAIIAARKDDFWSAVE